MRAWEELETIRYLLRIPGQPDTILWTTCLSERINQRNESAPELTGSLLVTLLLQDVAYSLLAAVKAVLALRFQRKCANIAYLYASTVPPAF